ncbi:MAG TPA: hypothetical protein VHG70_13165 [Nocardioidaceae bacterium]|nr:hypothetical protein [Nocardioidaceae bacterium]
MRVRRRKLSALAAVAVLAIAGCGGSQDEGAGGTEASQSPTPAPSTPAETTTSPASPTESQTSPTESQTDDDGGSPVETEDDAVEIEVEIENGRVTPSGERVDVELGQTIRFVVDSDAADEIHVHSTPEHTFGFRAGADDREFEFKLDQPGVVEAELHELGDVVVTIAARP